MPKSPVLKLREVRFTFQVVLGGSGPEYIQFYVNAQQGSDGQLEYVIALGENESLPVSVFNAILEAVEQIRKIRLPPIEAQPH